MAGSINDLARYRFDRAIEELDNAKAMLEVGRYKLALNRSYYSIFHCLRAVNALDEFDSSKHSGVIAHFNLYHIKNGDFPKDTSKIIKQASEMREHADYEDFFVVSAQDAQKQVMQAEIFLEYVHKFFEDKL